MKKSVPYFQTQMNSIQKTLESNIEQLSHQLPLSQKMDILKESKLKYKEAQKQIAQAKDDIQNYSPTIHKVVNIADVVSKIETGLDSIKVCNIDEALESYSTIMDDISSLEDFIQNETGNDYTITD